MGGDTRKLARRFVLTLGGEVTQSAFHFGLNIALVRTLNAEHYGVFAIVMLIGGVSLTYVRALVGMPVSLLVSQRRGTRAARALETSFGSAALVLSAVIAAVAATLIHFWLHADALSGASFVGLWSLRSYLRTTLLAKHRQAYAGLSDLALVVSGTVLALIFVRSGNAHPLDTALHVLGGANLVAIAVALVAQSEPVRITFRSTMRRRFRSLGRQLAWSAVSTTTANAQAQGLVLLGATFAGPRAYAPIAAMLVLFSPIRLMAVALVNMIQPELATRLAEGRLPGFGKIMLFWTAFTLGIGVAYGFAAVAAAPLMGTAVFEGQSRLQIGLLVWVLTMTYLLSVVPRILLEILREFRLIATISAVSACIGVSVVAILLATTSPSWTLIGNMIAEMIVLAWSWIAVARVLRSATAAVAITSPVPVAERTVQARLPTRAGGATLVVDRGRGD